MTNPWDKIVDDTVRTPSVDEQFYEERLKPYENQETRWPAYIDRAAVDVLHEVAMGRTRRRSDHGATINRQNFARATGDFYAEGLMKLGGEDPDLARTRDDYGNEQIGELAFKLNEFRNDLEDADATLDFDRALAAVVEKAAITAIDANTDGAQQGHQPLDDSSSVADLVLQLLSDPDFGGYADELRERILDDENYSSSSLLARLDEPVLTTPLWKPQREALRAWHANDQSGYVEMATATGKTVLGLAAMALRYGALHPADQRYVTGDVENSVGNSGKSSVLVVAGNDLLLEQWRREFDTHLDIPRSRTQPTGDEGRVVDLDWGTVEFRTAAGLLRDELPSRYDLVVLDEAHNYSRGSERGWRGVFGSLVEESEAILAMSGSIGGDWADDRVRDALDDRLHCCMTYGINEAREDGIVADFDWEVWHAPAARRGVETLSEQTQVCVEHHDETTGELDLDTLGIELPDDVENDFQTYDELRSFVQTNAGRERRDESDRFDEFASAVLTRRTARWNLVPDDEGISKLIARHGFQHKCVVLVRGYTSGVALGESLIDQHGFDPDRVIALEGPKDRMECIDRFNETENATIIGPGKLLGTGVDMPDADVAINVAAKGGVNPSLVQRIGRVLRNPNGDKEARFYHVLAQPLSDEAIAPREDGRRLLRRISQFRALGRRIDELPTFDTMSDTAPLLARLERIGNESLNDYQRPLKDLVKDEDVRKELHELREALRTVEYSDDAPIYIRRWGGPSKSQAREVVERRREDEGVPSTDRTQSTDERAAASEPDSIDRVSEPASRQREMAAPTDGGTEVDTQKRIEDRKQCEDEDIRDLIRIALNEMSGVGDTETRKQVVDGLAEYGTKEGLREIAEKSEDEMVAKHAESKLTELLIKRISKSESKSR